MGDFFLPNLTINSVLGWETSPRMLAQPFCFWWEIFSFSFLTSLCLASARVPSFLILEENSCATNPQRDEHSWSEYSVQVNGEQAQSQASPASCSNILSNSWQRERTGSWFVVQEEGLQELVISKWIYILHK